MTREAGILLPVLLELVASAHELSGFEVPILETYLLRQRQTFPG